NLEEARPLGLGEAGESADDRVVDEPGHCLRVEAAALDIGIEDFEKVGDAVGFGVGAKVPERRERGVVGGRVVGEGDRIEPEVGEPPYMLEGRAAERPRRLEMV